MIHLGKVIAPLAVALAFGGGVAVTSDVFPGDVITDIIPGDSADAEDDDTKGTMPRDPATRGLPTYVCSGGNADVTFRWYRRVPSGSVQYLDVSIYNNGWAPGTFYPSGELSPTVESATWPGIWPWTTVYWRVNTLTDRGWISTDTGSFEVRDCAPAPPPPTSTPRPPTPLPPTPTPRPDPRAWLGSYNPPTNFCSFAPCIASFWNGQGYVVICNDGLYGKSGGRSGACSGHGGVAR